MTRQGFLFLFLSCFIFIGIANGDGRTSGNLQHARATTTARTTTNATTSVRGTKSRNAMTTYRNTTNNNTPQRVKTRQITTTRSGLLPTPSKNIIGRAATTTPTIGVGTNYSDCYAAYFTCMDQFCANVDDTYRRCACSARINEIKQKQSALNQTSDSLNTFRDLNLDVITKSANDVRAMTSASIGEQTASSTNDTSASNKKLNAISSVLAKAKSKSLSTSGTLDAGGDISSIWSTTDLASGANIANLIGEPLYNAVNAQCAEMVSDACPSSVLNMVISAYGMYIENDCAALATNLSKQKNSATASIRETEHEMNIARLENYDAHNALSINECINSVRNDLTAPTACGPDFVHCLDITGLYLNIDTGAPIYSTNFYKLETQISLSGDILNNQTNHMIVNTLNNKKIFAKNSLDKCRDISGEIWDEFLRQAITEIHQHQQEKIRLVKNECLGVVNQCYDTQTNQLKDFSNTADATLLGLNLETVEDLCREKLDTCSNLYGGGATGLTALVDAMHDIVNQKIVAQCQSLLNDFALNLCAVQSTDTIHAYPYTCRVYAPGDQRYATIAECNSATANSEQCGGDYVDSLYQRFVNYAMQVCIRPSEYETLNNNVPTLVLQDINIVMDKMHISMSSELSRECERMGGIWITTPYTDTTIALQEQFYTETGANKKWGYCKAPIDTDTTYVITFDTGNSSTNITSIVTFGETMPSIGVPTQSNKTFCGYYSGQNGTGTKYYDKNGNATRKWDIASNTTLYAYWANGATCPVILRINPL